MKTPMTRSRATIVALRPDKSTPAGIERTIVLKMHDIVPILTTVMTTLTEAVVEFTPLTTASGWPDSRRRDANICFDMTVAIDDHVLDAIDILRDVKRVVTRALTDLDRVLDRDTALRDRLEELATAEAPTS